MTSELDYNDVDDLPTFDFETRWYIRSFDEANGLVESPTCENSSAAFKVECYVDQESGENLVFKVVASRIMTSMKETVTILIMNVSQAKDESVSGTFTFSPAAKEFELTMLHPAKHYSYDNGFLDLNSDMAIRLEFKTDRPQATATSGYDVTSYWAPTTGSTTYNYSYNYSYGDNSKETTGYVGLKNQGATCYMNSMLQSLYHIPAFRRMVYAIHVAQNIEESKNIPLNLQRLFCTMQLSDKAVSTTALTESFGWDASESFVQHDVQEFCRVLLDKIERKLKGSELENSIADLFKGKSRSFIRCPAVGYESSRVADFYDVQMVVKGCESLLESFDKFIETEELTGDNQYQTEEHGKQDAIMGVEFVELPKVLHLHLGRFDFDFEYERQVKIDSRFEFPTTLNLKKYLAADCKDRPSEYALYGVLVHSGCVYAGHYYAFLRTSTGPQWYEFNDTRVSKVDESKAVDDNFGGDGKSYSGYLLVYVRRDAEEDVFAPVPDESLPKHLKEWMEIYQKEQEEAEKQKSQLAVHVLGDNCVKANCKALKNGFENTKVEQTVHLEKNATVGDLLEKLGGDAVNVWRCNTYGVPQCVFTDAAKKSRLDAYGYYINVYARQKDDFVSDVQFDDTAVWVKFFFPLASEPLQYIAPFLVNGSSAVESLYDRVLDALGLPSGTHLLCYGEARPAPTLLEPQKTFTEQGISDGSILIFQQEPGSTLLHPKGPFAELSTESQDKESPSDTLPTEKEGIEVKYALTAPSPELLTIVDYLASKGDQLEILVYNFADIEKPLFWLRFPDNASFKDLRTYIAKTVGIEYDPEHDGIELFANDTENPNVPSLSPISHAYTTPSFQFAPSYLKQGEHYSVFFNLVSGIPEAELPDWLLLTLQIADDGTVVDREVRHRTKKSTSIKAIRQSLFEDGVLDETTEWHFAETWRNKIWQTFSDESVVSYSQSPVLVAKVTEEQKLMSEEEGDRLVFGCFVRPDPQWPDTYDAFGCPFYVPVLHNDTVGVLKERIQKNLKITDATQYSYMLGDRYTPSSELQDDSVLTSTLFKSGEFYCIFVLDKRSAPADKKKSSYYRREEKAIKIDN